MTSFFLLSNGERKEAFWGALVVNKQRKATASVFPACLYGHVHAWNGQTKQKSGSSLLSAWAGPISDRMSCEITAGSLTCQGTKGRLLAAGCMARCCFNTKPLGEERPLARHRCTCGDSLFSQVGLLFKMESLRYWNDRAIIRIIFFLFMSNLTLYFLLL